MGRYSSDSNSREKNRNRNRYYNHKYRSSSTSSSESSRHSRRHQSKVSESRHHKKSKHRHRSNSSSDYSSSRHKRSSHSNRRKESYSKKKYRGRNSSSSSSSQSTISNKSYKNHRSSKASYEKKKSPLPQLPAIKEDSDKSHQKNVYNVMKKENTIKEINQEGFVFKIFKPLAEQGQSSVNVSDFNVPKLHEEIVHSLSVEDSTFLISNRERLLNAKYKLLTKQERCNNWAKILFKSYQLSQHREEHFN